MEEKKPVPNNSKLIVIALGVIVFLIGALAASYIFIIKPKLDTYEFAKSAVVQVSKTQSDIAKVNAILAKLQEIQDKSDSTENANSKRLLLRNEVDAKQAMILASHETSPYDPGSALDTQSELLTSLNEVKSQSSKGEDAVKQAEKSITDLENFVTDNQSKITKSEDKKIIESIRNSNEKSRTYLKESKKTFKYLGKSSQMTLKILPMTVSYVRLLIDLAGASSPKPYAGKLKDLRETMNEITKMSNSISDSDVPSGFEDSQKDSVKIIEIMDRSMKKVEDAVADQDYLGLYSAVMTLTQEIEPITTRSSTMKVNLMEDNDDLKMYKDISKEYQNLEKNLKNLQTSNKLPFLTKSD